jgi:hypothetical protein
MRGVEPREPIDLVEPVAKSVDLLEKHDMPGTFLMQYDTLIDRRFVDIMKALDSRHEVGIWLEMVQPLVEKAGLEWRGRWSWDWHSNVGLLIGYKPEERRKLIDIIMEDFQATFGYLPKSVGSWVLDAQTLNYLSDEYGIIAACNCKDQCGTDGMTLWGGYWNQGYYPSKVNALMPAQDKSDQIPIPIFRMLGADPIHQYDKSIGEAQGVVTLEPVYKDGGGNKDWIDWFFNINFTAPCLAFAYTQVGQENSFGWPAMKTGLNYQFEALEKLRDDGVIRVETLGESGRWFRSEFDVTPATAVSALDDWQDNGRKSVWYNSRYYRINLLWERHMLCLRDIHLFDQRYPERYLEDTCKTTSSIFDTLPVMDGYNWSTKEEFAGIRVVEMASEGSYKSLAGGDPVVTETSETDLHIFWPVDNDSLEVQCGQDSLEFSLGNMDWAFEMSWSREKECDLVRVADKSLIYHHNGFDYEIECGAGRVERCDRSVLILPENGRISLNMKNE